MVCFPFNRLASLQAQLQTLSSQLAILTEKRNKRKSRKKSLGGAGRPAKASSVKPVAVKDKKRGRGDSSDDNMPEPAEITYDMKRELSENINLLSQDKLPQVVVARLTASLILLKKTLI